MSWRVVAGVIGVFLIVVLGSFGFMWLSQHQTPQTIAQDPQLVTRSNQRQAPAAAPATLEKEKIYLLINSHRKDHDLIPLRVNPLLEQSAQSKIEDMNINKYWRHEDTDNLKSWHMIRQAGYNFSQAGENLAFGLNTPWGVFDGWVQSPTHNTEMLNQNYEDMGLAVDCQSYQTAEQASCVVVLHLGAL